MRIVDRDIKRIMAAPFGLKHYRALCNMVRVFPQFPAALTRYITNSGSYPVRMQIRTPVGRHTLKLYSYHDLLTVNEIFCRGDYTVGMEPAVIVDVGANIGIASVFFLTRNRASRVYAYEPVPFNVERFRLNTQTFSNRVRLREAAVADRSGTSRFQTEPTGRYGRLSNGDGSIEVQCLHINEVLAEVFACESTIDVLKIDTEGTEEIIKNAIAPEYLKRIGTIYYESNHGCVIRI